MKINLSSFTIAILGLTLCACGMQGPQGAVARGTQSGATEVNLGWNSVAGAQQGFYVEASSDDIHFTQVASIPDGTNVASIAVPSPGVYYFRVRSYNQAGTSPYTPVVTAQVE